MDRAVNELFSDKPEKVVLIPDRLGTAVVRKVERFMVDAANLFTEKGSYL